MRTFHESHDIIHWVGTLLCGAVLVQCILAEEAAAQVATQWTARYNGTNNSGDAALAIAVDNAGYTYVTGTSTGTGTNLDMLTVKYNSSGDTAWTRRVAGTRNATAPGDQGNSIAVDDSSYIYVTGFIDNFTTLQDFCTIKYKPNGDTVWMRLYDRASSYDQAHVIAVDISGNVYVTGFTTSGGYDYTTIKYNASGQQQWAVHYNGTGNGYDQAAAIAADASGNVYVTGYSNGSTGSEDYLTIKYNSSGDTVWTRRYNGLGNNNDDANAIKVDASGNVYVTGRSLGSGTGHDITTIKYNSSGDTSWIRRFDESSFDIGNAEVLDAAGNIYITGSTSNGFVTLKYNSSGDLQWTRHYRSSAFDDGQANAIVLDNAGYLYVTGKSKAANNYNDYATVAYTTAGDSQWAARYNGPGNADDNSLAIAVDNDRNVYITGQSYGGAGTSTDYATMKYQQLPKISVDPAIVNFLNSPPGIPVDRTVTIRNVGSGNLILGALSAPAAPFSIESDSCGSKTLTPAESCHVNVRFTPTSSGYFVDSMIISSNDPTDSLFNVEFRGTGESDSLQIFSVDSEYVVTNKVQTFHVKGKKFQPGMVAILQRGNRGPPGRTIILADTVIVNDSTNLDATFNLEELDLGEYDFTLVAPDSSHTTAPGAVFLLHYLVLPAIDHEGFGGFPVGFERPSYLLVYNDGNDTGYVVLEVTLPAKDAIDLRIMSDAHDTLWYSQQQPEDTSAILLLSMKPGETIRLALYWRTKPDHVIFPPGNFPMARVRSLAQVNNEEELVIVGEGRQFTIKGTKGAIKNQLKGILIGTLISSTCGGLAGLLEGQSVRESLGRAVDSALANLDELKIKSPGDLLKKVASVLVPTWADVATGILNCLRTLFAAWMTGLDNDIQQKAQQFCNQSVEEKDRDLAHTRAGYIRSFTAIVNKKSKWPTTTRGTVRTSWDPNDKTTSGNFLGATISSGDSTQFVYLIPAAAIGDSIQYTIHFENKAQASDSAHNVVVKDTLDGNFDFSTLLIDSGAARGSFAWNLADSILTVEFIGINLPPNQNPPEGEWAVSYSMKLKPNLPLGTVIHNRASIVFDFNPPILTSPVTHIVGAPDIASSKPSLNFGQVIVGSTVAETLWIKNVGGFNLVMGSVSGLNSPFTLVSNPCSADTLLPGDSCRLIVSYHPVSSDQLSDSLDIVSTDVSKFPFRIVATGTGIPQFSVQRGWNMVSLPLTVGNGSKQALFPSAISRAYTYVHTPSVGYQHRDTLQDGSGYWLKFSSTQNIPLNGGLIRRETVSVAQGWNMIGSLSNPIPASAASFLNTMKKSNFYEYHGSYGIADTIRPGKGYWIKVDSVGKVVLASSGSSSDIAKGEKPNTLLDKLNKVFIEDVHANKQTLYFGPKPSKDFMSDYFELPPPLSQEIFDARFASQRMVETYQPVLEKPEQYDIEITSAAYPIIVSWELAKENKEKFALIDNQKGKLLGNVTLNQQGNITITDQSLTSLILQVQPGKEIPTEFALRQNYPNPFNPSATIEFDLPRDAKVTLKIYDLLGREVATLKDNEQYEAGTHEVQFSANEFASGVYFYHISANSNGITFTDVKKMILLR